MRTNPKGPLCLLVALAGSTCQSTPPAVTLDKLEISCQQPRTELGAALLSVACEIRNHAKEPVTGTVVSAALPGSAAQVANLQDFERELTAREKGKAGTIGLFGVGLMLSTGTRAGDPLTLSLALGSAAMLFMASEDKSVSYGKDSLLGSQETLPPGSATTKYLLVRRAESSIPEVLELCFSAPRQECVRVQLATDAAVRRMRPVGT